MEIFREVSIDWLGLKWYFVVVTVLLLAVGVAGFLMHGGLAYGIDFTGGSVIFLKFNSKPDLERLRQALGSEAVGTTVIQTFDDPAKNTVQIRMQTVFASEQDVDAGQKIVKDRLRKAFDPDHVGSDQIDFNNCSSEQVKQAVLASDPDNMRGQNKSSAEIESHYQSLTTTLLDYRNKSADGLVGSLDDLKNAGVSAAAVESLKKQFYAGPFALKGVESVGAVVGADLRRRAGFAVGLSFLGMLVYIAFRFKPIYGVAAIVAVIHDVAITVGLFALTQKEISLTVIAALLTLVGYSVNDTIVIFDRVRENLRLMRKESLTQILNVSINQTLSRTVMTSGMTFLSVFALFLFGGEVLAGFSFTLTVGIIIGTYSTLAIAAPIVEFWYRTVDQKSRRKAA